MRKKYRKLGAITSNLELILDELIDSHDLQWHEVLALIHGWLQTHRPDAQEEYLDGTHPVYYYGPKKAGVVCKHKRK